MNERTQPPQPPQPPLHPVLVEEQVQFTLLELSRACRADADQLKALVYEGVLVTLATAGDDAGDDIGDDVTAWRFEGVVLKRARVALRLAHDLELTPAGVALVLDLRDQIEQLQAQLRRIGLA